MVVITGMVAATPPESGSISCAYVGVDPTESNDHDASVLEPVDAAAGDLVPVGVAVLTGEPVDDTVAAEEDVTVAAGVAAGVPAGVPTGVPAGVLLDDAEPDAVLVAAGVPAGVVVAAPVLDGDPVADADDEMDPNCVSDADCRVAVDDALGVDVAVLVVALVPEGVPVAAGVTVDAGVCVAAGVMDAAGVLEAAGVPVTAGVVVAAGVDAPPEAVAEKMTLSRLTVPVPTVGAGLANNLTQRLATLSAADGKVMFPAVEVPVPMYHTVVPNEVAPPPGPIDFAVVYEVPPLIE